MTPKIDRRSILEPEKNRRTTTNNEFRCLKKSPSGEPEHPEKEGDMDVDEEDPCQQARAAIVLKTACLFMVGGGGAERKLTMARREGCAMNETVRFGRSKIIDSRRPFDFEGLRQ